MTYHGQIQYLQIHGDVEWDSSVRIDEASSTENDGYVLKARVRRLQNCEIKPDGVKPDGVIYDQDKELGHLYFNTQPGNVPPEVRCAIMGRETGAEDGNWIYYVLFITECATQSGRRKFKRVGMGMIEKRFILFRSRRYGTIL
jgi:hypothetical protein